MHGKLILPLLCVLLSVLMTVSVEHGSGHLGCFRDKGKRDLPKLAIAGHNSVQLCQAACGRLGYKYAGVQYSKECWCGNKYGSYGRANNCNMKCSANKSQICGGGWANNVYSSIGRQATTSGHGTQLGCFRDKGHRDLPKLAIAGHNSVQLCQAACGRLGYKYAGVQYSKECWCGNKYGSYGRANNCNMRCSANKSQICGGGWANNVYRSNKH